VRVASPSSSPDVLFRPSIATGRSTPHALNHPSSPSGGGGSSPGGSHSPGSPRFGTPTAASPSLDPYRAPDAYADPYRAPDEHFDPYRAPGPELSRRPARNADGWSVEPEGEHPGLSGSCRVREGVREAQAEDRYSSVMWNPITIYGRITLDSTPFI